MPRPVSVTTSPFAGPAMIVSSMLTPPPSASSASTTRAS